MHAPKPARWEVQLLLLLLLLYSSSGNDCFSRRQAVLFTTVYLKLKLLANQVPKPLGCERSCCWPDSEGTNEVVYCFTCKQNLFTSGKMFSSARQTRLAI